MNVKSIEILDVNDDELLQISEQGLLSLNLAEMKAIQNYFTKLGRNPTDAELETIAQTWSEHCVHKTFRGLIEYSEDDKTEIIDNMLKSTIMRVTQEINKPWCVSVFDDNAGVIEFDEKYNVAFISAACERSRIADARPTRQERLSACLCHFAHRR